MLEARGAANPKPKPSKGAATPIFLSQARAAALWHHLSGTEATEEEIRYLFDVGDRYRDKFKERVLVKNAVASYEKEAAAVRGAKTFRLKTVAKLGAYDFEKQGYPLSLEAGTHEFAVKSASLPLRRTNFSGRGTFGPHMIQAEIPPSIAFLSIDEGRAETLQPELNSANLVVAIEIVLEPLAAGDEEFGRTIATAPSEISVFVPGADFATPEQVQDIGSQIFRRKKSLLITKWHSAEKQGKKGASASVLGNDKKPAVLDRRNEVGGSWTGYYVFNHKNWAFSTDLSAEAGAFSGTLHVIELETPARIHSGTVTPSGRLSFKQQYEGEDQVTVYEGSFTPSGSIKGEWRLDDGQRGKFEMTKVSE